MPHDFTKPAANAVPRHCASDPAGCDEPNPRRFTPLPFQDAQEHQLAMHGAPLGLHLGKLRGTKEPRLFRKTQTRLSVAGTVRRVVNRWCIDTQARV